MKRILLLGAGLLSVGFALAKGEGFFNLGSRSEPYAAEAVSRPTQPGESSSGARGGTSAACVSAEDVSNALKMFTSENVSAIDQAQAWLLSKSGESEQCRAEVIAALMKAMDRPHLDFTHDKDSYYLWLYGAEVLGELKASEALDLLVSHLHLMDRNLYSSSMTHQPALRGVVEMGPVAIPKLDAVLRESPNPELRFDAVYCIATIGGPKAVESLSQALGSESNECVSRLIRISLDSFDEHGRIKDRFEWSRGLLCKW